MHLLVATDFSEAAELALDRAISLASLDPGALLTVMHVQAAEGLEVIRQMFSAEVEKMDRALELDAADRLKAIAEKCEGILGRKIITHLSHGRPEAEIIGTATELSADLIIMGAQGKTPVGRPFLGGTIERVLYRSDCSVLVVKQPAAEPYRRILVGVNSGSGSPTAAEFAFLLNPASEMILLHAFEAAFEDKFRRAGATDNWVSEYRLQSRRAAEQELEQVGSRLDAAGIQAQRLVVQGPAAAMIVEYGNSLSADLIVVGKHKRSILGDLIFGDVAHRITMESKADVLIASSLPNLRALSLGESMN